MADQEYSFAQARTRLEEIVTQVRSKDMSLEKSLDLLEEGVRLANTCTELSDHTEWRTVVDEQGDESDPSAEAVDGVVTEQAAADEDVDPGESEVSDDDSAAEDNEEDEATSA